MEYNVDNIFNLFESLLDMRANDIKMNEFEHQLYEESARTLKDIMRSTRLALRRKMRKKKKNNTERKE